MPPPPPHREQESDAQDLPNALYRPDPANTRALLRSLEQVRDALSARVDQLSIAVDRLRGQASEIERAFTTASSSLDTQTSPEPPLPLQFRSSPITSGRLDPLPFSSWVPRRGSLIDTTGPSNSELGLNNRSNASAMSDTSSSHTAVPRTLSYPHGPFGRGQGRLTHGRSSQFESVGQEPSSVRPDSPRGSQRHPVTGDVFNAGGGRTAMSREIHTSTSQSRARRPRPMPTNLETVATQPKPIIVRSSFPAVPPAVRVQDAFDDDTGDDDDASARGDTVTPNSPSLSAVRGRDVDGVDRTDDIESLAQRMARVVIEFTLPPDETDGVTGRSQAEEPARTASLFDDAPVHNLSGGSMDRPLGRNQRRPRTDLPSGITTRGLMVRERQGLYTEPLGRSDEWAERLESIVGRRLLDIQIEPRVERRESPALDRDVQLYLRRLADSQREWTRAWRHERNRAVLAGQIPNEFSRWRETALRNHVSNSHRLWYLLSRWAGTEHNVIGGGDIGDRPPLFDNPYRTLAATPSPNFAGVRVGRPYFETPPNVPPPTEQHTTPEDVSVRGIGRRWIDRIEREETDAAPDRSEFAYYRDILDPRRRRDRGGISNTAVGEREDPSLAGLPLELLQLIAQQPSIYRELSPTRESGSSPAFEVPPRSLALDSADMPFGESDESWLSSAGPEELIARMEETRARALASVRELPPEVLIESRPSMRHVLAGLERMLESRHLLTPDLQVRLERLAANEREMLRLTDTLIAASETASREVSRTRGGRYWSDTLSAFDRFQENGLFGDADTQSQPPQLSGRPDTDIRDREILERIEETQARIDQLDQTRGQILALRAGMGLPARAGRTRNLPTEPLDLEYSDDDTVSLGSVFSYYVQPGTATPQSEPSGLSNNDSLASRGSSLSRAVSPPGSGAMTETSESDWDRFPWDILDTQSSLAIDTQSFFEGGRNGRNWDSSDSDSDSDSDSAVETELSEPETALARTRPRVNIPTVTSTVQAPVDVHALTHVGHGDDKGAVDREAGVLSAEHWPVPAAPMWPQGRPSRPYISILDL